MERKGIGNDKTDYLMAVYFDGDVSSTRYWISDRGAEVEMMERRTFNKARYESNLDYLDRANKRYAEKMAREFKPLSEAQLVKLGRKIREMANTFNQRELEYTALVLGKAGLIDTDQVTELMSQYWLGYHDKKEADR